VGIATTIAVVFHEIPQEIGDFGVLLYGGYTKNKALFVNFLTALAAILGAVIALVLSSSVEQLAMFIVPFAAGNFIYIAGADLIPEIHKEVELSKSIMQGITFILGVLVMLGLLFLS
jgi:zinc and cadmium transporter